MTEAEAIDAIAEWRAALYTNASYGCGVHPANQKPLFLERPELPRRHAEGVAFLGWYWQRLPFDIARRDFRVPRAVWDARHVEPVMDPARAETILTLLREREAYFRRGTNPVRGR